MKTLLVDDAKAARYVLRSQLQKNNAEVETAESAEAAFEILKTQMFDAIFMDHMMPGLNGFEALDILRDDPRTSKIPVVMCSSHEDEDFIATAKQKGVFGILPKSKAPELLPGILDLLREHMAKTASVSAAAAPVAPQSTVLSEPAGLSEEDIINLINPHLEQKLNKILPPLLEALRHDLVESIRADNIQLIESRLNAETNRRSLVPTPTMADLQALRTNLAAEVLPEMIRQSIDNERSRLIDVIDKQLREALPKTQPAERPELNERILTAKIEAIAKREAQEGMKATQSALQQALQKIEKTVSSAASSTLVYIMFIVAILIGAGAAAAVYFIR